MQRLLHRGEKLGMPSSAMPDRNQRWASASTGTSRYQQKTPTAPKSRDAQEEPADGFGHATVTNLGCCGADTAIA